MTDEDNLQQTSFEKNLFKYVSNTSLEETIIKSHLANMERIGKQLNMAIRNSAMAGDLRFALNSRPVVDLKECVDIISFELEGKNPEIKNQEIDRYIQSIRQKELNSAYTLISQIEFQSKLEKNIGKIFFAKFFDGKLFYTTYDQMKEHVSKLQERIRTHEVQGNYIVSVRNMLDHLGEHIIGYRDGKQEFLVTKVDFDFYGHYITGDAKCKDLVVSDMALCLPTNNGIVRLTKDSYEFFKQRKQ